MVSRTVIGRSFKGLIRYQFEGHKGQGVDKGAELLTAIGVRASSPEKMIADFNRGRRLNTELGKPVWHTSLSFNPSDTAKLDNDKMLEIAEGYVRGMGLDKTQYVIIRHHDRPGHEHLHIIANRVANDGRTIDDSNNFYRSKEVLTALVKEHGLTPPEGLRPEQQRPEQLQGVEKTRYELKELLHQALTTATNRAAFEQELQGQGVSIKIFRNTSGKETGISFAKDEYALKGSTIGREYSLSKIEKQLDINQERKQAEEKQNAEWYKSLSPMLEEALRTGTRTGFDSHLERYGFTYGVATPGQPATIRHRYGQEAPVNFLRPNGQPLPEQLVQLDLAEQAAIAQKAEQARLAAEQAATERARQLVLEAQRVAAQQWAAQEQLRQVELQRIAAATRTLTLSTPNQSALNRVIEDLRRLPDVQVRESYTTISLEVHFRIDKQSMIGVYESLLKGQRRDASLWITNEQNEGPAHIMPKLRAAAEQQGWRRTSPSLDSGPRISQDRELD